MKSWNLRRILSTFRTVLGGATVAASVLSIPAGAQNVVTEWTNIAVTQARASTAPGSATPGGTSLYMAYVELAVYNSVVAIHGGYEPYKYSVPAPRPRVCRSCRG